MSINTVAQGKIAEVSKSRYRDTLKQLVNGEVEVHGATYVYNETTDTLNRKDLLNNPIVLTTKKGQKEMF